MCVHSRARPLQLQVGAYRSPPAAAPAERPPPRPPPGATTTSAAAAARPRRIAARAAAAAAAAAAVGRAAARAGVHGLRAAGYGCLVPGRRAEGCGCRSRDEAGGDRHVAARHEPEGRGRRSRGGEGGRDRHEAARPAAARHVTARRRALEDRGRQSRGGEGRRGPPAAGCGFQYRVGSGSPARAGRCLRVGQSRASRAGQSPPRESRRRRTVARAHRSRADRAGVGTQTPGLAAGPDRAAHGHEAACPARASSLAGRAEAGGHVTHHGSRVAAG